MIHTPIDTPVQAYIYRLIQLNINTHFSFQDTFFLHSLPIIHWYIYSSRYLHITHLDTPVQAYIYILIQSVIVTYIYLALKIHLVLHYCRLQWDWCLYTDTYIRADTCTLYTKIRQYKYIFICYSYTLIHIFNSQDSFCSYLFCRVKIGLTLKHWYIYFNRYIHTYTRQYIDTYIYSIHASTLVYEWVIQ